MIHTSSAFCRYLCFFKLLTLVLLFRSQNNVAMLLEINYRERLHTVTNEVKRRLDYQVALQDLHRRLEKEHMVNWVEKSVISSISPQQVCVAPSRCFSWLLLKAPLL